MLQRRKQAAQQLGPALQRHKFRRALQRGMHPLVARPRPKPAGAAAIPAAARPAAAPAPACAAAAVAAGPAPPVRLSAWAGPRLAGGTVWCEGQRTRATSCAPRTQR